MHSQLAVVCLYLLHIENVQIEDILADAHIFKGLLDSEQLVLSLGFALS